MQQLNFTEIEILSMQDNCPWRSSWYIVCKYSKVLQLDAFSCGSDVVELRSQTEEEEERLTLATSAAFPDVA